MRKILFWAAIIIVGGVYLTLLLFGASALALIPIQNQNPDLRTRAEILRSITETVAIFVAGIWTYNRFIKSREDHPYPKIQHRIEHYNLEKDLIYLSVFVTVVNEGKTKLDLSDGKIYIRQVLPITETMKNLVKETRLKFGIDDIRRGKVKGLFIDAGQRLGWVTLGDRKWDQLRAGLKELEPSQTREIQFDFLLVEDDDAQLIEIISYFEYAKSSWELATLYSLTPSKAKKQTKQ
jgi:hypothetical protein